MNMAPDYVIPTPPPTLLTIYAPQFAPLVNSQCFNFVSDLTFVFVPVIVTQVFVSEIVPVYAPDVYDVPECTPYDPAFDPHFAPDVYDAPEISTLNPDAPEFVPESFDQDFPSVHAPPTVDQPSVSPPLIAPIASIVEPSNDLVSFQVQAIQLELQEVKQHRDDLLAEVDCIKKERDDYKDELDDALEKFESMMYEMMDLKDEMEDLDETRRTLEDDYKDLNRSSLKFMRRMKRRMDKKLETARRIKELGTIIDNPLKEENEELTEKLKKMEKEKKLQELRIIILTTELENRKSRN
jgi:Ataxin-2 C-terminal region